MTSSLTLLDLAVAALAAAIAGLINSVAGGGTLISFPVLTALGVPAVQANATNTVALLPGYFGGVWTQRHEPALREHHVRQLVLTAFTGGFVGSLLLVLTSEAAFRTVVPFLILSSVALMVVQDRIRARLTRPGHRHSEHAVLQTSGIFLAATYGGYFGAGLGIMLLAVLGLFSDTPFGQLNSVKLALAAAANVAAAGFLVVSGKVMWLTAVVMLPAALIGGSLGARVAQRVRAAHMRRFVIGFGCAVAMVYLFR